MSICIEENEFVAANADFRCTIAAHNDHQVHQRSNPIVAVKTLVYNSIAFSLFLWEIHERYAFQIVAVKLANNT